MTIKHARNGIGNIMGDEIYLLLFEPLIAI
jgi:hypothetical protein